MSGSLLWAVAVCVLGSAAADAAEPAALGAKFRAGEVRRYDITADYRLLAGEEPSGPPRRHVNQSARVLLTVDEVEPSGAAMIRLQFERYHAERAGPGGESAEVFDWVAEQAPEENPNALALLSGALVGCTMDIAVAPDGSVETVTGLLPLAAALKEQGGDSPAMQALGFFSPLRLKVNLATLWRADPQGRAREPGATWRTSEQLTLGEGVEAEQVTEWVLAGVEGPIALVTGAARLTTAESKREADPASPTLEIMEQAGTVTLEWDAMAAVLVSRVEERSVTWGASVDLGPGAATPSVTAESRATSRVEIRLVK
jgi:hypothetical protein